MANSDSSKPLIAVDLDEVLGRTIDAIIRFHNAAYGTALKLADFTSYNYWDVWGGDREGSIRKIREFYQTKYFLDELEPVPGALEALQELKKEFRLVVVTSRQEVVHQETLRWIERHYAGVFEGVHLGNAFLSAAEQKTMAARDKSSICAELGAVALIDDSLMWAEDCTRNGIRCILFDLDFSYGWSKKATRLDKFIKRVGSWKELLENKHLLTTPINRFDVMAVQWDDRLEVVATSRSFKALLKSRGALNKNASVLDFGCGTGLLSLPLAEHVASVLAVDMSEGMINVLQQKIDAAKVHNVRALHKELKTPDDLPERFDLVVSCLVFHHIDDLPAAIKLLHGLLKPGGVLVVLDLERHPNETELFHPKAVHTIVSHHGIATSDMRAWYKAAGFVDIAIDVPAEVTKPTEVEASRSFPLFYAYGRRA